jgi:hypothetical protein
MSSTRPYDLSARAVPRSGRSALGTADHLEQRQRMADFLAVLGTVGFTLVMLGLVKVLGRI